MRDQQQSLSNTDTISAMNMTTFARARSTTIFLILTVAVLLLSAASVNAQATNDGTISGTITNQTTGQPQPDLDVTLSAFTTEGLVAEFETSADDSGSFSFDELDTTDGIVYAASVTYRGVLYSSGMIQFQGASDQTTAIDVFETTTDRSVVGVNSRGIVLSELDPESGRATILDITSLTVAGDQTFVAGDTGRSVEFPIPRNAATPTLMPGFDFGTAVIENSVLYASSALRPEGGSATLRYPVQYTGTSFGIDVLNAYPTETFRVLIPVDLTGTANPIAVSGAGLEDEGTTTIGEVDYHVWTATDLRGGGTIRIGFSSLPESSFQPNQLRILEPTIMAGLALMTATALTVVVVRRKGISEPEPALEASVTAAFIESREELVLQLQELQDEYDNGIVDEELFLSERRLLLERLRTVSRHLRETPEDAEN